MPSSIVFLGPSLKREAAQAILDTEYRPPIRRGDIEAILRGPLPAAVGIIDGQFLQNFSISPKEILKGMDAGIRMFGSSSMGALRAVELARYGMVGSGTVFQLFFSGVLDADDEVAMTYDPEDGTPASEPLVNIRVALAQAAELGVISLETRDLFIEKARQLYFPQRTYRRVLSSVSTLIPEAEAASLAVFLQTAPDTKREDAIQLLEGMREYLLKVDPSNRSDSEAS